MAHKEGCGTNLGKAQDVKKDASFEFDSKRDVVFEERTISANPSYQTPTKTAKSDHHSELVNSLKVGLVSMADGFKAIAIYLSTHSINGTIEHLLKATKARLED